jgi:hypothetical protein
MIYYSVSIVYNQQRSSSFKSEGSLIAFRISQLSFNFTIEDGAKVTMLVIAYDASTGV